MILKILKSVMIKLGIIKEKQNVNSENKHKNKKPIKYSQNVKITIVPNLDNIQGIIG